VAEAASPAEAAEEAAADHGDRHATGSSQLPVSAPVLRAALATADPSRFATPALVFTRRTSAACASLLAMVGQTADKLSHYGFLGLCGLGIMAEMEAAIVWIASGLDVCHTKRKPESVDRLSSPYRMIGI
jgi:hypothetical protein